MVVGCHVFFIGSVVVGAKVDSSLSCLSSRCSVERFVLLVGVGAVVDFVVAEQVVHGTVFFVCVFNSKVSHGSAVLLTSS